jgi:hypothetical protein
MNHEQQRARMGLTMIEVTVSAAVLGMLLFCVAVVTHTSHGVFLATQARDVLRQQAQSTLDRIADAIETSGKSTFSPSPVGPFGSSTLDFQAPLSVLNGVITWAPKTRICLQAAPLHKQEHNGLAANNEIVLIRDPGLKTAVTTVLAGHVADSLEGEIANGKDDNGNGLVDEKGLSFLLVGDQLTIALTLGDTDSDGQPVWVTTQTQIRLKN